MTVKEFIGTLESSDRLRIIEGKAEAYVGYLAAFKPRSCGARLGAELISTSYTATMRTSISHQNKPIRTLWSLPRVRKHGKGMRYSLPPI